MKRKLKVAQVVSSLAFGGAERCALDLAAKLDRERFETTLLVAGTGSEGPLRDAARERGVQVRHVFYESLRHPLQDAQLVRELLRYDVVHAHNRPVDFQIAALLAGIKLAGKGPAYFWTCHLPYPHDDAAAAKRYRRAAGVARKVVACAPVVEAHLKDRLGIPPGSVVTIANGVDTARYRPFNTDDAAEREKLRAELGAGDAVVLISSGRLAVQKGFDRLLSAAALLGARDDLPSWQLWIAGDGPERDRLTELIPGLRLQDQVKLLGARSDLDRLLRAADLYVLLSRFEGLPLALLEALSSGLPAVVTGIPAFTTLGLGKPVRCLDESSDEIALVTDASDVLAGLIVNSDERKWMGSLAREETLKRFDIAAWVRVHENLYS